MEDPEETSIKSTIHAPPPPTISLTNFSPSITPTQRRLSSQFSEPTRPINSSRRLSWVSLQGRLIDAEEASFGSTIKGGLSKDEVIAWDLFTPIHRILIVAVVAVASNELKKSRIISSLQRSVELRDQVLLSMQQKLDNLCEQMYLMKDRPETMDDNEFQLKCYVQSNKKKYPPVGVVLVRSIRFYPLTHTILCSAQHDSLENVSGGDEMSKFKMLETVTAEQEERRMSDLSDWASSVTSAADMQLNSLGIEQDIYNLQRECEEKDATIKELSAAMRSADIGGSKRIAELEDIIRRKNMVITKLKKDMLFLEQKVVQLVRLRRPSSASTVDTQQLPMMTDNVLYDMDSTTSPSSSDSDSDMKNQPQTPDTYENDSISSKENDSVIRRKSFEKASISVPRTADGPSKQGPISPLKENMMNHKLKPTVTLRPKHFVSSRGDMTRNKRSGQHWSKETITSKRWT